MDIAIIGFSSIVKRKVIPALIKFENLKNINIFSRRVIEFNYQNNSGTKINFFNIDNLGSFIKSNNIFFYYISTENSTHFDYAKLLLNLKQNVVIDKPIVIDSAQLDILMQIAHRNNCFIGEALNWEHHKQVKYIKDFVKRNKKFNVNVKFTIPIPEENSFRVNNQEGSGVFWDMNSYLFSTLLFFTKERPVLHFSKNIGKNKPQWIKAYLRNTNFKFDGLFGFGFNYQNKLELHSESEIIIFDRIYTSEPTSPVNIYRITNEKFDNIEVYDDSFFNYLKKTMNSILNKDHSHSIDKIKEQYKNVFEF